jgi:hypothetical protein
MYSLAKASGSYRALSELFASAYSIVTDQLAVQDVWNTDLGPGEEGGNLR